MTTKIELPEREIVKAYENHQSTYRIARKYHVNAETIRKRLNSTIELRYRKKLQVSEIINLYQNQYMGTYQIAKKYGVCHQTIGRLLKKNNVILRDKSERHEKHIPINEIMNLHQVKGENVYAIAEKYKVCHTVIERMLREQKINPTKNKTYLEKLADEVIKNNEPKALGGILMTIQKEECHK